VSNQSVLLPLVGNNIARPVVRIQPTAQRATPLANVGWKWRRRYAVFNGCAEPLLNHPYAIDLGLTNGLVSGGKALSSGNDLRVWREGQEIKRTLVNWNDGTHTTLVWVHIPYLAPGDAQLYDVVYGNANAGSPPTLTDGVDAPAFDVATAGTNRSSNAKWAGSFAAGKGGWWLSSGSVQPQYSFSVPGAWEPASTRSSYDDRRQEPFTLVGGSYKALFSARRARAGSLAMSTDRGADGVSIHHPAGIASVRCNLLFTNQQLTDTDATPIGKLMILGRRVQGEEWFAIYENDDLEPTETTIATTTYTPAGGNVYDVAFAVWPHDGLVVDATARDDRYVEGKWSSVLELNLDNTKITQTLTEAEVEIYELADEVRYGGGGSKSALVPPYNAIRVGNTEQASGAGTPRASCKLNEQLVIFADGSRAVEIWNSGLTARVESVPLPAVSAVDGVMQGDGTTREQPAQDWLPLLPVVNPLTNPSATVNVSNWERGTVTSGVTSTFSRETATSDSSPACFEENITANTAGAGAIIEDIASDYIPVGGRNSVGVGLAIRVGQFNLQPTPTIWFYDKDQVFLSKAMQADWTIPAVNTWYRRLHAAAVPASAVFYRVGVTTKIKTAALTGLSRWDTVAVNDAELAIYDPAPGTLGYSVAILPRY
jgi:hypothetical protein